MLLCRDALYGLVDGLRLRSKLNCKQDNGKIHARRMVIKRKRFLLPKRAKECSELTVKGRLHRQSCQEGNYK